MSEKSTGKPVKKKQAAVTGEVAEKKTIEIELVYSIEKLRENSVKLFGITSSTFDGAMYGQKKTEMTIAEAKSVINKWLGRKEK